MNFDDLMLAIEGDDPKPLRRFGSEIEEILEEIITDCGAGDLKTFQIIPPTFGPDLFEGVEVNGGKRHGICTSIGSILGSFVISESIISFIYFCLSPPVHCSGGGLLLARPKSNQKGAGEPMVPGPSFIHPGFL